jgi:hypothetical protein
MEMRSDLPPADAVVETPLTSRDEAFFLLLHFHFDCTDRHYEEFVILKSLRFRKHPPNLNSSKRTLLVIVGRARQY